MQQIITDPAPGNQPTAAWGCSAHIDIPGCDRGAISNPATIRAFFAAVVPAIGMKAHGPPRLERFGDRKRNLLGWSGFQFIETSNITVHADEVGLRCFVDVFSCKPFDAVKAARVAGDYFGGTPATVHTLERGIP